MTDEKIPNEITVELSTDAKFSLAAGQSENPDASNDELVAEALTSHWPVETGDEELSSVGARGRYDSPEQEQLTDAERREADRMREELSSFL